MPGIKRILQEESKYTPMKKTTHTVTKSSSRSIIRRTLLGIAETQYVDNNAQNSTTTGGFVACLNQMAEGTDYSNRVGKVVQPMYLYLDWCVRPGTNLDDCFIAVVYDRQPNASTASYSTIFASNNSPPVSQTFPNIAAWKERFKILYQERVYPGAAYANAAALINGVGRKYIKLE